MASTLLGDRADLIEFHRTSGTHLVLSAVRVKVTCRSRYTEDRVARSVRHGLEQYVILGAALDLFAYRPELAR